MPCSFFMPVVHAWWTALSPIGVVTDHAVGVRLVALPPGATVELDGTPTGAVVEVPVGRHTIALANEQVVQ